MPKSLAEQRAEKKTRRPQFVYEMCLAQDLLAEVSRLATRMSDLLPARGEDDGAKKPKRVNDPNAVEAAKIAEQIGALEGEMAEYTGELLLQTIDPGDWIRFVQENPARPEGDPGRDVDLRYTGGVCDAEELVNDLRRYAVAWSGDPITDDDWAHIVANGSSGDFAEIARMVVDRHETGLDLPKLRTALRGIRDGETG